MKINLVKKVILAQMAICMSGGISSYAGILDKIPSDMIYEIIAHSDDVKSVLALGQACKATKNVTDTYLDSTLKKFIADLEKAKTCAEFNKTLSQASDIAGILIKKQK